jgi:hypothetical protein
MADEPRNPKLDPHPGSNTEKPPDQWVSGDEPMTGAQASYLTTLSEQAGEPPPPGDLTKAEASRRIDALNERLQPGANPGPRTGHHRNEAALPGSQNEDLRGARRDRRPRGMST